MELAELVVGRGVVDDLRREDDLVGPVVDHEPPAAVEKPADTTDAGGAPGLRRLERAHEHLVEAERVGAELLHHGVGVDDVAAGLRHLVGPALDADLRPVAEDEVLPLLLHLIDGELRRDIIFPALLRRHPASLRAPVAGELHLPQDHPLVDEPAERFGEGDVAAVVEDLVPEAGIEEVEHGVLRPADVEVDRHPGPLDRRIDEAAVVARIEEP